MLPPFLTERLLALTGDGGGSRLWGQGRRDRTARGIGHDQTRGKLGEFGSWLEPPEPLRGVGFSERHVVNKWPFVSPFSSLVLPTSHHPISGQATQIQLMDPASGNVQPAAGELSGPRSPGFGGLIEYNIRYNI